MLSKYAIRNSSTAYRIIDGTAIIVGAPEGKLRTLNRVGTLIWEVADGKLTVSEIINLVCDYFEVDYAQAARDAEAFIRDMESKDMMLLTDSPVGLKVNQ